MTERCLQLADVLDTQNKGWLELETISDPKIMIPYLTKIGWNSSKRAFFLMNGYYKGYEIQQKIFETKYEKYFSVFDNDKNKASKVEIDRKKRKLYLGDIEADIEFTEYSVGQKYYILAPTITKKHINNSYLNEQSGGSRFAETWFPFVSEHDKYPKTFLHFGMFSRGCILVSYKRRESGITWSKLFEELLSLDYDDITLCEVIIK